MFTTGETVGLAEWIIDETCLVFSCFSLQILAQITMLLVAPYLGKLLNNGNTGKERPRNNNNSERRTNQELEKLSLLQNIEETLYNAYAKYG